MKTVRIARAALVGALAAAAGCATPHRLPEARLSERGCRELPDRADLARLRARVETEKAAGKNPIVIFDLDDTLVDGATRTRAIFVDALRSSRAPRDADRALEQLDCLCVRDYALELDANLDYGEYSKTTREYLKAAYEEADTVRYLDRAIPFRGAAAYVNELKAKGATIAYVTERPKYLEEATLRALKARGFPVVMDGAILIMQSGGGKADSTIDRYNAAESLAKKGVVVGTFDNEPANVEEYRKVLPEAIRFLMVSRHRENAPRAPEGTRCIVDYRESR